MTEAEKVVTCRLVGECCWDGTEDGPACWNVGACGCKAVAHSPAIHPLNPPANSDGGAGQ